MPPTGVPPDTVVTQVRAGAPDPAATLDLPSRYEDLGLIGAGGTAEVRRVWDRRLERTLAMKILRWSPATDPELTRRFEEEARLTAGLQHPGVIAVHDQGLLADGRPWITLNEVRGRTLNKLIVEHGVAPDPMFSLRRLVEVLRAVCLTVAHAHRCGVVHRDIKPGNLMVGEHQEVLVLDWGLATGAKRPDGHAEIEGTPGYLAPEGLDGGPVTPATDVYALGCVLYEILTGRRPYVGSPDAILDRLRHADPDPVRQAAAGRLAPDELCALCEQAMARDPARRLGDADALAGGLQAWLDGARRRALAESQVAEADATAPQIQSLRQQALALRADADAILAACAPHDPELSKRPGWDLQDQAAEHERQATVLEAGWVATLRSALSRVEELPSAHARLADHYRERIAAAESVRDEETALRAESWLRRHDRGKYAAFLRGDARLSLRTEPADAALELRRYVRDGRRLVLGPPEALGTGPIQDHVLPSGSALIIARAPGYETARLPILLRRGEVWDATPPGAADAEPLRLLPHGALGPDDVYVPAGCFQAGGDPEAADGLPAATLWLDGFILRRYPVTCADYLCFLNALVADGRADEAEAALPRETGRSEVELPLIFRDEAGVYGLSPHGEGATWKRDWPVTMVSWHDAAAYARWMAHRTGLPWRLPHELEWAKAARGVDGRIFPWGDHADPTWARMVSSQPDRPQRVPVDSYPIDISPYGVRGLGGNVRDWCADAYRRGGAEIVDGRPQLQSADPNDNHYRLIRGGCWASPERMCRAAARFANRPGERASVVGFRLARSVG